jgi:cob(I)alamin adenosyltransferase
VIYLSRIYTKSGDQGDTGLGDGQRVRKDHPRVAAYGEVDELNSIVGLVLTVADVCEPDLLRSIQNDLFDVGADLCVPARDGEEAGKSLRITQGQAEKLEKAIDRLNEKLRPLHSFILPGGAVASAYLHLARTICRRAERSVVTLMAAEPINPQVLIYLNRLSDLLFVLARVANHNGEHDILWVPGGKQNGNQA